MEPIFLLLVPLVLAGMWLLSANTDIPMYAEQTILELPIAAAKKIYKGALIGRNPATGYVEPFRVCDEFIGIAYNAVDNSAGAAGALTVKILVRGDFVLTLSGVAITDFGRRVYATADDTVVLNGHALAYAGHVLGVEASGKARIRLKNPGEQLGPIGGEGAGPPICRGGPWTKATGNNGGGTEYLDGDGCILSSTLGLGTIPTTGRLQLSMDDTDEASHESLQTYAKFDLDKGIVARFKIAAYSTTGVAMTGANVDFEFGLADAIVKTAVDPARHVRFHVDGAGTTLLLGADDNVTDVAETDTTLELPKTLATAEEYVIIIRADGTVEVYNEGTLIATPSLALIDFTGGGLVAAYVNVEKSSAAGIAIIEIVEFQCFGGF